MPSRPQSEGDDQLPTLGPDESMDHFQFDEQHKESCEYADAEEFMEKNLPNLQKDKKVMSEISVQNIPFPKTEQTYISPSKKEPQMRMNTYQTFEDKLRDQSFWNSIDETITQENLLRQTEGVPDSEIFEMKSPKLGLKP